MGIISRIPIQVMSAVVYPQQIEFSRFLFEVKSKHFHQYTPLARQDKVKNISQLTTLIGALLCKFRQTCFRVLSTQGCRYNKKEAETSRQGSGSACGTEGYLNVTPCFLQIHRKVSIPIFRLRRHLANCSSHSVG